MTDFIGPKNAETRIGCSWRWCRDTATALGVRVVRLGRKTLIPAVAFEAALLAAGNPQLRKSATPPDAPPTAPQFDSPDAVLDALGLRRKGAP